MKTLIRRLTESKFSKFIKQFEIDSDRIAIEDKELLTRFNDAILNRKAIISKYDSIIEKNKLTLAKN